MKEFFKIAIWLFFLTGIFLFWRSYKVEVKDYVKMGPLDTIIRLKLYLKNGYSPQKLDDLISSAFYQIKESEEIFSYFPPSLLAQLNQEGKLLLKDKKNGVLADFLRKTVSISSQTKYYFNPFLGKISELWGFLVPKDKKNNYQIPPDKLLKEEVEKVKNTNLIFDKGKIILSGEAKLDLGGIAKGYIVEKLYHSFKDVPFILGGIIDVGGDMILFGKKSYFNSDFQIAIRSPWGGIFTILSLPSGKKWAIATSGDYERFFTKKGKKYWHLLDPFTGRPARKGLRSVTVISDSLINSDALATAIFVGGEKLLLSLPSSNNFYYYVIKSDKQVLTNWKE